MLSKSVWLSFAQVPALALAASLSDKAISNCPPLGPVLPAPQNPASNPIVKATIEGITAALQSNVTQLGNATALSLGIASIYEKNPILSFSHTPTVFNKSGTHHVDGDTVFRIGSVSKTFTVLALQMLGGKVNLADPITKYIPELCNLAKQQSVRNAVTTVDWEVITLDSLASQLSGIPYDLGDDIANLDHNLTQDGLPKLQQSQYAACGASDTLKPCEWDDFWKFYGKRYPVYGPYTTAAYTNIGYDLLGMVIERVSKKSYAEFVRDHILTPLEMHHTTTSKPANDSSGFIPKADFMANWWSTSYGFLEADGGFYSSANDLLTFGRAILTNKLLSPVATRAWLKPKSHTSALGVSVGAPWEIGRSTSLTMDGRVVDVYSKNGGLGLYNSLFLMIPDYGLVLSLVMGGESSSLNIELVIASQVLQAFVPAIEAAGKAEATRNFAGKYVDKVSNSSIVLEIDDGPGLLVTNWTSLGKDVLQTYADIVAHSPGGAPTAQGAAAYLTIRLYPTSLQTNSVTSWRAVYDSADPETVKAQSAYLFIIQGLCETWSSLDNVVYGLRGLDNFLFDTNANGSATAITPVAFAHKLTRQA
ncbi:Beta-lactamase [Arthrobotrys entomopaga]|nr:Beta-lactamase [Arthrobotrys entomopaga]